MTKCVTQHRIIPLPFVALALGLALCACSETSAVSEPQPRHVWTSPAGVNGVLLFQAALAGDRAILAYEQSDATGPRLLATVYENGAFTTPVAIDPGGGTSHEHLKAALFPSGKIAFVFTQQDASGFWVYGAMYANGQFSAPVKLVPDAGSMIDLQLAQSQTQDFAVIASWKPNPSSAGELWVTTMDGNGFGANQLIDDNAFGPPQLDVARHSSESLLCLQHSPGGTADDELRCAWRSAGQSAFPTPDAMPGSPLGSFMAGVSPSGAQGVVVYGVPQPTAEHHEQKGVQAVVFSGGFQPPHAFESSDTVGLGVSQIVYLDAPERAFIAFSGLDLNHFQNFLYQKWAVLSADSTFSPPQQYGSIGDTEQIRPRWIANPEGTRLAALWGSAGDGPYVSEFRDDAMQPRVPAPRGEVAYLGHSNRILIAGLGSQSSSDVQAFVAVDGNVSGPAVVFPSLCCGAGIVPSSVAPSALVIAGDSAHAQLALVDQSLNVAPLNVCPTGTISGAVALAPTPAFLLSCLVDSSIQLWTLP
ncbi:MAG: hypothetical protein HY898_01265 [Deltaproteobacteria bacterium]|nr:hypothetical protein [Deltaproteobacteria bacterium]